MDVLCYLPLSPFGSPNIGFWMPLNLSSKRASCTESCLGSLRSAINREIIIFSAVKQGPILFETATTSLSQPLWFVEEIELRE